MLDPVIITEDLPSGAKRVELRDSDLPYGLARAFAAFHSGGEVAHEEIYLPGRETPIYQIKQARQRPMVLKGAFRDHLYVRDGGDEGVDHARQMRDALEQLRRRANPLVVSWASESRKCFLAEADFGEENAHEISYELTFKVSQGAQGAQQITTTSRSARSSTIDVGAELQRIVATRRAQAAALAAKLVALDSITTVITALDSVTAAIDAVIAGSASLLSSAANDTLAPVARLLGAVATAQDSCRRAQGTLAGIDPAGIVPPNDPESLVTAWRLQQGGSDDLAGVLDALRTIAAESRAIVRQTVRLYRVAPGDTLESIAQRTLGSASRASDLGIRPEDLVVGATIAIPEAA